MSLSITPSLIIAAAKKRGWNVTVIQDKYALYRIELTDGRNYYLRGITGNKTSAINMFLADHKEILSDLVTEFGIIVPASLRFDGDFTAAEAFLKQYEMIVVKPTNLSHGNGVTVDITTVEQLRSAIEHASELSKSLLLQQQIIGDDYRVLMIGGSMAAAAIREPAFIIGDGQQTVGQLIETENARPERGHGYSTMLTRIDHKLAERYLGERLQNIPAENEKVRVIGTANIGKGGVSIDVTDTIERRLIDDATKIVEHFAMGVCGVDFLVDTTGTPYLIEINSGPSLGLHEYPYQGQGRGTPERFLDWLTEE